MEVIHRKIMRKEQAEFQVYNEISCDDESDGVLLS